MLVQVSVSLNIFDTLTYNYEGEEGTIKIGQRVVVPVGNRPTTGWVMETHANYKGKVKNIIRVIPDAYESDTRFINYVKAVSELYLTSAGSLLDSSLSPKNKLLKNTCGDSPGKNFCQVQGGKHAFFQKDPLVFLIGYERLGEYREIIDKCIGEERSVLIVAPDNLTAAYLKEKLVEGVDVYNSELKGKDRERLWMEYAVENKVGVVVGGLSAVMLPIRNLGVIICDRAGSSAYRRSFYTPYHINVLAKLRAEHFEIPYVEGFSAYTVHAYRNRSQVVIKDRREEKGEIKVNVRMIPAGVKGAPDEFVELLSGYFREGKKILVVLNKKESVNFLYCGKCKKLLKCPACGGFIDVDESLGITCRRCGLEKAAYTHCPKCKEELSIVEDISVASVNKIIKHRVVETGVMSISSEGLGEEHIHSVLKRIDDSKIVVATPVIVNPVFKDKFDVIIYIRPESYFNLEEYDAAEKIYSMVSEFRELVKRGGSVEIFSTFHFHYSLKMINEEGNFFERELKYREWFQLPPYSNVYHIEVRGKGLRELGIEMRKVYKEYKEVLNIKRVYLKSRKGYRGAYKGVMEIHTQSGKIKESVLLKKRDISVELMMV